MKVAVPYKVIFFKFKIEINNKNIKGFTGSMKGVLTFVNT